MNRDTFNRIYGNSSISEAEMDRKYRVFIREKEELEMFEHQLKLHKATADASLVDNSINTYVVFDYVEDYVV